MFVVVLGCSKSDPSGGPAGAGESSGNPSFDQHCSKCHIVKGEGKKRGPNLAKIGAEPTHTVDWLAGYISDPKSVTPDSKMPSFKDTLKPEEIRALAEFLAAHK